MTSLAADGSVGTCHGLEPRDPPPAATLVDVTDRDDLLDPDGGAPICPGCGVTALPDEHGGFVCENPDCEGHGDPV